MTADRGPKVGSVDSRAPTSGGGAGPPWLLVVARGHTQLLAELQTIFREDPRVRVIEDRRHDQALLPRRETVRRAQLRTD
jgi:hypothetical protein